jgi:starch-binding outer membrane protein, SusD/RagB family
MKKKLLPYIIAASFGLLLLLNSCEKRLDIAPLNILTSEQIFASDDAVNAYLASLYNNMQKEDFGFSPASYLSNTTDEAINCFTDQGSGIGDGTNDGWWQYGNVRYVNDLIGKVQTSKLSAVSKSTVLGEAYFIRAYYYFSMVKRYGGIPIVKKVLTYTGSNLAELQVPRNKEQEVYDFIASDLDSAALLLLPTSVAGHANKGAALALKSRAMLYAASSAKYGSVQLGGVLGIPASEANKYWQASYDAAAGVIALNKYSLYNKLTDKTANFQALFLDASTTNNTEQILSEYYLYGYKTHTWDCMVIPFGIRGPNGFSSRINPTLDLVEQFEYVDGTPGTLKIGTPASPIYYTNAPDLFLNKDPRLLASVIVPFSTFKGNIIDIQSGIYDALATPNKYIEGDYNALYNPTTHKIDASTGTIHVGGKSGPAGSETTQTGFNMKKYLDPNLAQALVVNSGSTGSTQPWMMLRYGEVLLNYAEAAIELNKVADAKDKVNQIRARAGIVALADADITIARVRKERLNELAFENHRWYDYRRWHQSDLVMNSWWPRMLKTYWDIQQQKYRFETGNAGRYQKTFNARAYYERIPTSELTLNLNLVQNPGY